MPTPVAAFSVLCVLLSGCAVSTTAPPTSSTAHAIQGSVFGGQQPVSGAHVYVFAASAKGYGSPSVSLLNAASTGQADSVGAYVTTSTAGSFDISGDYTCTPGDQVYLLALGGNPGAGDNSAVGLLAILGECPQATNFVSATPFISVNEISTIGAAYAFSGFAKDAVHVASSGTPGALLGIAHAFANAANLVDVASGTALTLTPGGNGIVPQAKLNTLGNILATCVNSAGPASSGCTTLFKNAVSSGIPGNQPNETATAAINIAHSPGSNLRALFQLLPGTVPFEPALTGQPADFALAIQFSGGGVTRTSGASGLAIDGPGNVWVANSADNTVSELSFSGTPLSPATGFSGGGLSNPTLVAIDLVGNAWVSNLGGSVCELSAGGLPLSPMTGYTGGGIYAPSGIAVDGLGNVWVSNRYTGITELSSSGTPLSPSTGYADNGANGLIFNGIAIDQNEDAWVSVKSNDAILELSQAGNTLSPGSGFTGGGLYLAGDVAVDSAGSVWVANGQSVSKFSKTGTPLSISPGFTGQGVISDSLLVSGLAMDGAGNAWVGLYDGLTTLSNAGSLLLPVNGEVTDGFVLGAKSIAVDASGDVWATNTVNVVELVGAAVPVLTPLSQAVKSGAIGTLP